VVFPDDLAAFGKVEQFPKLPDLPPHRALPLLDQARAVEMRFCRPEQFVEIGEGLATELGITAGDAP